MKNHRYSTAGKNSNGHYTAVNGGPASGIPVIVRKSVQ